ncbi:hypothetical protein C1646_772348 [Rhizophagus diaphanus]|nr:hypothetical protein C1646_772348 [Rhizophagus diaphanus] [Rhizophagus sp. MUCL 43196]
MSKISGLNESTEDIQDIIKAKKFNEMGIRNLKDIKLLSEKFSLTQQADPVECNIISGSKIKKTEGKKFKFKSIHISNTKDLCENENEILEEKKEIILSTEFSEDVLDLYKKTDNTLEGIKARGHPLITK